MRDSDLNHKIVTLQQRLDRLHPKFVDASRSLEEGLPDPLTELQNTLGELQVVIEELNRRDRALTAMHKRLGIKPLIKLLGLSRILVSAHDADTILKQAINSAIDIASAADRGSLQLLDPAHETLRTVAVGGVDDDLADTIFFQPGVGIAGNTLAGGEMINVPDVLSDERFVPGKLPLRFRSLLVAPLVIKDRFLGTLSLSSERVGAFSLADETLIRLIADQTAVVLENARLFTTLRASEKKSGARIEERADELAKADTAFKREISGRRQAEADRERLLATEREQRLLAETLGEVVLALTSQVSLKAVLDEILRQTQRIVTYSAANIMLLEDDTLRIVRWQGYEAFGSKALVSNLEQSLANFPLDAEVVRLRKPILVSDTKQNRQWVTVPESAWIHSFAAVPICLHDQVLGLLRLDSEVPGSFSEMDVERLNPLANAAAIALENARMYEQVQQKLIEQERAASKIRELNHKLYGLQYAGATVVTSLDLQKVLHAVMNEMVNLLGVENCSISVLGQTADTILVVAEHIDPTWNEVNSLPHDHHLVKIFLAKQVMGKAGARQMTASQPNLDPVISGYMQEKGIKALLVLPMEVQGSLLGLVEVGASREETIFTIEDIGLAQLLANQAAVAIQNARLYEKVQQELDERRRVEKALQESEANLRTIFDTSLQVFVLFDREGKVQTFNKPARESTQLAFGREIKVGDSIYDFVLEENMSGFARDFEKVLTGEPVSIDWQVNIGDTDTWFEFNFDPVFAVDGQVIGVCFNTINIDQRKKEAEALAKSEARLMAELHSVLAITRALVSETDLDTLLGFIMTQAEQLANVDGATVLLFSDDDQRLSVATPGVRRFQLKDGLQVPVKGSLAELAIATRHIQVSNHARGDDRVAPIRTLLQPIEIQALLCALLMVQGKNLGVLVMWCEQTGIFPVYQSHLVGLFANQAALALHNAHLHVRNCQLAIEEERHRIARELHDTVTQSFYSISMAARTSLKLLGQSDAVRKIRNPIEHILTLSKNSFVEMREQIYHLSPSDLTDKGLVEALTNYCSRLRVHYDLTIEFTADPELSFTIDQQVALYYIAKEALWNIVKHTKATKAGILLFGEDDKIVLSVQDDGIGFDPSIIVRRETMGLRNMEERATLLGGHLEIQSEIEQGSIITAFIPKRLDS